jgi:hypothetical protein
LLDELHPLLNRHGFRPVTGRSEWTGKFNIFSWVRNSWKEDLLRLGWRKPPVSSYFLDAQWSVPGAGGRVLTAAGLNAGYARRGLRGGDLPMEVPLIGALMERRWRTEVVADAEFAVSWCDRCATRDGALDELARADRNGPPAGSDAYAQIEQYVRAHGRS